MSLHADNISFVISALGCSPLSQASFDGWWREPLPAIANAWRGPLQIIDTTFTTANESTPAIRSMASSDSAGLSNWTANPIVNGSWAHTYILSGNTCVAIHLFLVCVYTASEYE